MYISITLYKIWKMELFSVKFWIAFNLVLLTWKRFLIKPTIRYSKSKITIISLIHAKKLGLTLVGIGGNDITDGNKKLILAILWQLMKYHTFSLIGKINEDDVLKWGNSKIEAQF